MSTLAATQSTPAWRPGAPVRLETPNFIIRSLEPGDADDRLVSWFANERYMYLLGSRTRDSREEVIRHIGRIDNARDFLLGIFARDTGLIVGWFRAYHDRTFGRVKLNILIGEKLYRGRRNTAELHRAIHGFLFRDVGVRKIFTTIFGGNTVSRRLVERCGYQLEGLLRKHAIAEDGSWCDVAHYGMFEPEWRATLEDADG